MPTSTLYDLSKSTFQFARRMSSAASVMETCDEYLRVITLEGTYEARIDRPNEYGLRLDMPMTLFVPYIEAKRNEASAQYQAALTDLRALLVP